MNRLVYAYDHAVQELLEDIGLDNQRVVSFRLDVGAGNAPYITVKKYVTEGEVTSLRKFFAKLQPTDLEEVEE